MAVTLSLSDDAIMTVVRTFLLAVLPANVEVFQSQANRVAEPIGPNFVMMTQTSRGRLATTVQTWDETIDDPDTLDSAASTQITVQLDHHGPEGANYSQIISTLAWSDYGAINMDAAIIQPLFATDGHQIPFVNGENQVENRWVQNLVLQATPIVSTPQDFAATLTATLIPTGA